MPPDWPPPNQPPPDHLLPDWPPPSTPLISLNHGIQVHLQTCSITSSKCIAMIAWLWPQSTCANLFDHGFQVQHQTCLILACMCISKCTQSQNSNAALSSLDHGFHPTLSPNLLNHSFQDHYLVHAIGVVRCSSDTIRVPSAARLAICIYIDRLILRILSKIWCSKSCDWNKDKYDTQKGSWLRDIKNHCCDHTAPGIKFPAELCRGLISCSWTLLVPCAESLSCTHHLLLMSTEVSAAPTFYYPRCQIS